MFDLSREIQCNDPLPKQNTSLPLHHLLFLHCSVQNSSDVSKTSVILYLDGRQSKIDKDKRELPPECLSCQGQNQHGPPEALVSISALVKQMHIFSFPGHRILENYVTTETGTAFCNR